MKRLSWTLLTTASLWLSYAAVSVACDTEMICAWKRTFYTHNYVNSPLRPYSMPRTPNLAGWGSPIGGGPACQQPPVILSQGFERLGRIPNDMDLSPASVVATPTR
jgi:hypothetical protein